MARYGTLKRSLKAPRALGDILFEGTVGKRAGSLVQLYQLQKEWGKIVGPELARRTLPKELKKATLVIAVESSAWAQHLSFMREKIIDVIFDRLGQKIEDIRFVNTSLPKVNRETKEEPPVQKPTPPSAKNEDLHEIIERVRARGLALKSQREKSRV